MNTTNTGLTVSPSALLTGSVAAPLIALIGAILVAVLFLGKKRKGGYKGLMQKISAHVNFDRFLLSTILKFLYAFAVIYCVVNGLIALFTGAPVTGLLWLALGPVALRVVFEQLLLILSIRNEVAENNDLLRRMQGLPPKNPPQPVQQAQPAPAQAGRAPAQGDPRYAQQRPAGYNANQPASYGANQNPAYGAYANAPRQAPARPNDYGSMTQRYAPVRGNAYNNSYEAGNYTTSTPVVRPTPADGTGRFTAVPRRDEGDPRTK